MVKGFDCISEPLGQFVGLSDCHAFGGYGLTGGESEPAGIEMAGVNGKQIIDSAEGDGHERHLSSNGEVRGAGEKGLQLAIRSAAAFGKNNHRFFFFHHPDDFGTQILYIVSLKTDVPFHGKSAKPFEYVPDKWEICKIIARGKPHVLETLIVKNNATQEIIDLTAVRAYNHKRMFLNSVRLKRRFINVDFRINRIEKTVDSIGFVSDCLMW